MKKKKIFGPIKVPENLEAARHYLQKAYLEDEDLGKFTVKLDDGHLLKVEELHGWLIEAINHYEKFGPRAQALKTVQEVLKAQYHPARQ